jgi:protein-S-isoprenylcysteine O-methyltransferase Ste14
VNPVGAFFARWRVRVSYPLAILVLWFARPTPRSILWGAPLGLLGLFLRARAAGHLHKQEVLTVTGPYAYTRNPLYFGSSILTLGASVAANSWLSAAILCAYFLLFYSIVMRREEVELRQHHGAAFDEYASTVPLFFPRLTPAKLSFAGAGSFSFAQYKKNHEYQAAIGFLLLLAVLLLIWWLRLD